nr:methylated-DNA--[protein]-cysteine S-methyltransferase [uncultured Campylobacter sp.]
MKFIAYYDSPLGKITLAGDEAGLCGLWFEGEKYYAHALAASGADKKRGDDDLLTKERHAESETQRDFAAQDASKKSYATDLSAQSASEKFYINEQGGYFEEKNLAVFDQTRRWLDLYFSGREPGFTPALNPAGSAFRRAVWEILLKIPYGKTTTYGQIAREIAAARGLAKMSAQAVGGAVGHNEISIIIPCHRVIGAHGNLTGYAGGIDRKIKLLQLEGVDMRGLFTPAKGTAL